MANLLLFKKAAQFEVYNDVNSNLVNFFRVLRDEEKFKKLLLKIHLTPYSREEYYHCKNTLNEIEDEVLRAYKFYITINMAFSGDIQGGWSHKIKDISRNMPSAVSSFLTKIENLPSFHQRIKTLQIENLDWKKCCEKYNRWGGEGFYYLDPPYVLSSLNVSKPYLDSMTDEEHWKLVAWLLSNCRVKVLLSGYENEIYQVLEKNGWNRKTWDTVAYSGKKVGTERAKRVECVWYNYDLKEEKEK